MNAASDVVRRMIDVFAQQRAEAVIAFEEVPRSDVHRYGIADPKSDGDVFELADVIEKPSVEEAPSSLAIAARYVFAPSIYDAIDREAPGKDGEIQLHRRGAHPPARKGAPSACACAMTNAATTLATSTRTSAPSSNSP